MSEHSEVDQATREKIEASIREQRVVLFMKGNRRAPQCGFSAAVVELLDEWLDDYATVDVLADADMREAIKRYSEWPTIPQLYVDGEFVGGADILRELDEQAELAAALGVADQPPPSPEVTITELAAEQIRAAFSGDEVEPEDELRLTIDARYHNDLAIGPRRPGDVAVTSQGLSLLFDRRSARRANGLVIDFVQNEQGAGFKIENPNAPASVRELSAKELAARMASDPKLRVLDVRTAQEHAQADIAGSTLLDSEHLEAVEALAKDTPLVLFCHHGVRSRRAAEYFVDQGFREVYNLTGGIDAWSLEVDPAVPRY
ncbi:Grx4 family monothiol glutaredoxin [Pseudenhygromyxa sp. WMMC2535]|uniref:Grx4 family monothiol glutaredoxin n=1 Tax=Pseudenhygromyxa sp. WMMC2535 TaxID=2712867 RepID=UPI001553CEF4|nr:Grx4 family monothiol glutaredoxin [Pseudenhygromyxa sp. WMMC2535]NVB38113.1 Grx4 family monothiol glutaredoxin [Pseudenhygromyxa sp. WMMC2535]